MLSYMLRDGPDSHLLEIAGYPRVDDRLHLFCITEIASEGWVLTQLETLLVESEFLLESADILNFDRTIVMAASKG